VTPLLVAAGVAVALGAAVAVGAQRARTATLGLLATLVLAPFVADPLPGLAPAAFRVVAGTLATFLLVVAARRADPADVSPLGLPAALAAAAAAFAAAFGATAVGLPSFGPVAALGAGLAALVVAVGPIVLARDGHRLGLAAVVLVNAALLLRAAFAGTPPALESLLAGIAVIAVAAGAAVLAGAAATAADLAAGPAAAPLVRQPLATSAPPARRAESSAPPARRAESPAPDEP
jgi:hypothetical protein